MQYKSDRSSFARVRPTQPTSTSISDLETSWIPRRFAHFSYIFHPFFVLDIAKLCATINIWWFLFVKEVGINREDTVSAPPSRPWRPSSSGELATPRSSHHLAAIAAAGVSYPPPLPPTPHASALATHDAGAGGAARQIVDSLLARFLPLARRRIETAQAQVIPPISVRGERESRCSALISILPPRVRRLILPPRIRLNRVDWIATPVCVCWCWYWRTLISRWYPAVAAVIGNRHFARKKEQSKISLADFFLVRAKHPNLTYYGFIL
jgi:hypothetical protein